MANVYPGVNDGVVPFDPQSDVGKFRVLIGDTEATQYDPVEPGRGNYEMFSDNDIEATVAASGGSITLAVGYGYQSLAGKAAQESKVVKDFDLSVDLTKRATDLRLVALQWFDRADKEKAATEDAFEIADLVGGCDTLPEAMFARVGRYVVWGDDC